MYLERMLYTVAPNNLSVEFSAHIEINLGENGPLLYNLQQKTMATCDSSVYGLSWYTFDGLVISEGRFTFLHEPQQPSHTPHIQLCD